MVRSAKPSRFLKRVRKVRRSKINLDKKLEFDKLEPRRVLNAHPIANYDLSYFTDLNTILSVTSSQDSVLANDFDAEGSTLTATKVDDPSNGSLTFNSDGTFTYTPDTGFTGVDSFTYEISDGTDTSIKGTAQIAVGQGLSGKLNGEELNSGGLLHAGVLALQQPLGGGLNLTYRSDSVPTILVPVETFLPAGTTIPNSITANLTIAGVSSGDVNFGNTGLATGEPLRITLRSLPTSASTGMYDWSMDVTLNYSGSSETVTFTGSQPIVNRTASEFGNGWWLDGLDRLHLSTQGALLVAGNGDTHWFEKDGSNYLPAVGDHSFSTLTTSGGTYTLTDKWGNEKSFNSSGYITEIQNLNNSVASLTFTYDGSNRISKITDEFNRDYDFTYNGSGKLTSVNDFHGRDSTLVFSGNNLQSITVADETFTGYTAPEWSFGYTSVGGQQRLTGVTDPALDETTYIYDSDSHRISEIQHPDHTVSNPSKWQLFPTLSQGLAVAASGNTVLKVANMDARYIDELGNEFGFTSNQFGSVTSSVDALGAETTIEFDSQNLPYRITGADPDGAGSQVSPVTKYGYGSLGDHVLTVYADGTTTKAEYDSTLHRITRFWNQLNVDETFTYYSDGDLKDWTDGEGNKWSYTYDSHGNLLTETSPDPDGTGSQTSVVTTYQYDSTYYNRLTRITFADSNYQSFTYNSYDEMVTATDELGNVTSFTYDPLSRMVSMTLPDPDGAGGQAAAVLSWAYGANLLVSAETDELGNTTNYEYDSRGNVTKITLPDPDGIGSLTSPELEYEYNVAGQLVTETRPEMAGGTNISYTYDDNGRVTEISGPLTGQDTTFTYDALGRTTELVDASGRTIVFEYDALNRLVKETDHDPDGTGPTIGPTTLYAYDAAGQLTSVTDPLGRVTSYAYMDNGWLEATTTADPDGSGPLTAAVYTSVYDAMGRMIESIDPAGRETTYDFDVRSRIIKVTNPDPDGTGPGNTLQATHTDYVYDAAGRLTQVTEPLDLVTSYSYDNLGRLLSTTLPDPDGTGSKVSPVVSQTYDARGNVLSTTDANGNVTTYAYDNLGRMTTATLADPDSTGPLTSPVHTYTFNNRALLASYTNPEGVTTTYGYDNAGRKTTETDALGNVTSWSYDVLDRIVSTTDPDPDGTGPLTASVNSIIYDIYSRVTQTQDANGGTTNYAYDKAGQLLSLTDQSGNATYWAYDDLGRMTMETDELGHTRSYDYNSLDRMIRMVDREGRTTLYGFEGYTESDHWYEFTGAVPFANVATTTEGSGSANEVQTVTLQDVDSGTFRLGFSGQTTAPIDYDATAAEVKSALEDLEAIDTVTVTLSGSVYTVTFTGDLANTDVPALQGAVTLDNDGDRIRIIERVYDEGFRLVSATDDGGGADYTYTVDDLGRVTQVVEDINGFSSDVTLNYDYDSVGNRIEVLASLGTDTGTADDYKNTYFYDDLNRISTITQQGQTGGNGVAAKHIEYVYNSLHQVTYINRFEGTSGGTGSALRTKMTYDGANRLLTIQHRDVDSPTVSTALNQYTYGYDNASRITSIDSSLDGISNYTFDKNGQLTDADHAGSRTDEAYTFDATGNRTGGDYVVSSKNRTDESTGYEYEYDKEGNRTKRTKTSDSSYEVYTFDHRNRLTSVKFHSFMGTETKSINYEYDLFGRMVRRTFDSNGSSSGGVSDTFWAGMDGIHATFEFDGNSSDDLTHRYLWGQFHDDLLAVEEVTSTSSAGDILWTLTDQVGTIRDIAEWNATADDFEVTNHRVYNSFGELESETNSSVSVDFDFTGKWRDSETGYTHHLNRWYDSEIGKWISEDPIGFAGGDTNISRYVSNRVLHMIDSNGLFGVGDGGTMQATPPGNTGAGSGNRHDARNQEEGDQEDPAEEFKGAIKMFLEDLKEKAKETKDVERGGYILKAVDPDAKKKYLLVEVINNDAEKLRFPLLYFPKPGTNDELKGGLVPKANEKGEVDMGNDSIDADDIERDYVIIYSWHTHPPFPDGDAEPSANDKKNSDDHNIFGAVIQYLPPRGGRDPGWSIFITDPDGDSTEYDPDDK